MRGVNIGAPPFAAGRQDRIKEAAPICSEKKSVKARSEVSHERLRSARTTALSVVAVSKCDTLRLRAPIRAAAPSSLEYEEVGPWTAASCAYG